MSVKNVAAIIVAALVAGVVLGSLGVAGANPAGKAAIPGVKAAECSSCPNEGACDPAAAPAATPQGGCPDGSCDPAAAAAAQTATGTGACDMSSGQCDMSSGTCDMSSGQCNMGTATGK